MQYCYGTELLTHPFSLFYLFLAFVFQHSRFPGIRANGQPQDGPDGDRC